eukprot:364188-Chlamydomonas_euryale.AAC.6
MRHQQSAWQDRSLELVSQGLISEMVRLGELVFKGAPLPRDQLWATVCHAHIPCLGRESHEHKTPYKAVEQVVLF